MTAEHRFECVLCRHRIRAPGADSEAARQNAREAGAAHLRDAHADHLAATPAWPDEPGPTDLLSGEAAYGPLRGLLVPADDLLVCADCGYYFGSDESDPGRTPVDGSGLVCTACSDRRGDDHEQSVADAIDAFVR